MITLLWSRLFPFLFAVVPFGYRRAWLVVVPTEGIRVRHPRYGWVCFEAPSLGAPWFLYASPSGHTWHATAATGPGASLAFRAACDRRRLIWGHGFDPEDLPTEDSPAPFASILDDISPRTERP